MTTDGEPVLIWGAGAMGGTIGAFLARAGFDVTLVDRVPEHVDAINGRGLTITGPVDAFTTPARASTPERLTGTWRCILLCVKGQDTVAAVEALAPHLADDGYVASIQNGLNENVIAGLVGARRTLGAFINFGSDYHAPGEIFYGGRSAVVVGEIDSTRSERAEALAAMLRHFEPDAIATDNIWGYVWSKLGYCSLLWANALGPAEMSELFASRRHRPMLTELTREVIRIGEKRGLRLQAFDPFDPAGFVHDASPADTDRAFEALSAQGRTNAKVHSGMWRDIAVRKRRTEADTLLVPVLDEAAKEGIPTPLNTRMLAIVRELENGTRAQSWDNLDELVALMG